MSIFRHLPFGFEFGSCDFVHELRSQRCTCIWYNKNIRSKSRQYFYYDSWYERGICTLGDILYDDVPTPVLKSFDDLIIEFDISYRDRRKYKFLMKSIFDSGILDDFEDHNFDTFDIFFQKPYFSS